MSKVKEFFKELEEDYGYDKSLIISVIVNVFFMFRGLYQYSEPWIFFMPRILLAYRSKNGKTRAIERFERCVFRDYLFLLLY